MLSTINAPIAPIKHKTWAMTEAINNNPPPQMDVAPLAKHFGAQTVAVNVWVATASLVAK